MDKSLKEYTKYKYAIDDKVDYKLLATMPNVSLIVGRCSTCSMKNKCLYFKETYDKINESVRLYVEKKKAVYKKLNLPDWEFSSKCRLLEKGEVLKKQELYAKYDQDCKIEQKFVSDIIFALDRKYDFEVNPEFKIMCEDIIIGKIKSFRLNNFHSMSGVIMVDNQGRQRIAPGMNYGLEFAKTMADIITKMDIIKNGIKTVNVNVNTVPIPVEDLYKLKKDKYGEIK